MHAPPIGPITIRQYRTFTYSGQIRRSPSPPLEERVGERRPFLELAWIIREPDASFRAFWGHEPASGSPSPLGRGRGEGEGRLLIASAQHSDPNLPADSPSPPLEERVGERR